jgi:hypothetical protein
LLAHVTQECGKIFYFVNIPKDELVIYMVIVKWRHTTYAYGVLRLCKDLGPKMPKKTGQRNQSKHLK